jgi:hypothetical protein
VRIYIVWKSCFIIINLQQHRRWQQLVVKYEQFDIESLIDPQMVCEMEITFDGIKVIYLFVNHYHLSTHIVKWSDIASKNLVWSGLIMLIFSFDQNLTNFNYLFVFAIGTLKLWQYQCITMFSSVWQFAAIEYPEYHVGCRYIQRESQYELDENLGRN